ncbi:MarR family transcriptional regulator [Haliea sp. E1-2-M8]|uniref:MarR family transcriptional regulator n=1 Tax=Haliea sp. E1-2-M8 TaxID=3064706 RepID=UPI002724BF54|nr:MarR family transcriptional regulator [Haliea sp. E1-2-M8]MDO8861903.1 MarR family transcriptional regulator [Haliea sp. E1-2-M8]
MTAAAISQAALDAARQRNLGHRLVALADDFSGRVLAAYHLQGYTEIRPVHGAVLRNLELGGTRLTVLAARAGITHRAMAKLVAPVMAMGLIQQRPDPEDARARLISYTPRGIQLLQQSSAIIESIYRVYSRAIGAEALQALELRLYEFLTALDIEITLSGQQALHSVRPEKPRSNRKTYVSHNIGRYLQLLGDDYHRRCARIVEAAGHTGVRIDHLAVVSHLSLSGMTLSQLSESAGITLQATGKQVASLQRLGYITVAVDSRDKRVRRVAFSAQGHAFIAALLAAFASIEADYSSVVGRRKLQYLQTSLAHAASALGLSVPLSSPARL